ncbi:MAG: type IV pilus biogenesis protein PilM [Pyramidobacter sp.]
MRWNIDRKIKGAALSIREDRALYAELLQDGGHCAVINGSEIPLPPGLVHNDHLVDGRALGSYLRRQLRFCWGKLPLAMGLPSSDFIFRTIKLATSDLDEAKSALRWCFSDFFPFKYEEALFDVCKLPSGAPQGQILLLGTACRKGELTALLESLKSLRCRVSSAEPLCVACARAFALEKENDPLLLVVGQDTLLHLIFFKQNAAWMFRTLDCSQRSAEELNAEVDGTLRYIREHYGTSSPRLCQAGKLPDGAVGLPALDGAASRALCRAEKFRLDPPAAAGWYDVVGLLKRHIHED